MVSDLTLTLYEIPETQDGVVHLDMADMHVLGVSAGDLVCVEGARRVHLLVMPAFMGDRNQRLARVSPLTVSNLGSYSGQKARLLPERVKLPLAERVTVQAVDDLDQSHLIARHSQLAGYCLKRAVAVDDEIRVPTLGAYPLKVKVIGVTPAGGAQIGHATEFSVVGSPDERTGEKGLPAIGGVREAYLTCQKLVKARFSKSFSYAARSALLTGPEGCGKATMVARLAKECGATLHVIDGYRLLNVWMAQGISGLETELSDLDRRGSGILLLDHLEALVQVGNSEALAASTHALIEQLCAVLDELPTRPNVFVFGVIAGEGAALGRLAARFDFRLCVDAPNRWGRSELLHIATNGLTLDTDVDLGELAAITSGMTARDLFALTSAASYFAASPKVRAQDFMMAFRNQTPSAHSEILCDIPLTYWDEVAGLDDIKQVLLETLTWSLFDRDKFLTAGVKPPRSILLSGGQGTGKTSVVRALTTNIPMNYIEIACPAMMAKYQNDKASFLTETFALARRKAPCLVFFDDIDALFETLSTDSDTAPHQHPLVAQLVAELDALPLMAGVVVVAATNRPDRLTQDILRPGRFDFAMTLPMPDNAARKKVLQIHARKLPLSSDIDFDRLAGNTQGMSSAELANLCNRV
ncbi:MAG TPA: hypothetical protein DCY07_06200, partial [Rhodospirillaceae bacterium]|nr:hypothetical protein [Rhodospirillaceae bacterium]